MSRGACWWRRSVVACLALVPVVPVGACGGDGAWPDDPTTLGILTGSGELVAALQDERRATRALTTSGFDEPGTAPDWGLAGSAVDNALEGLAEAVDDADPEVYVQVWPTVDQTVTGLAEPRGMMAVLGSGAGAGGGGVSDRYTPLVTDVLRLHLDYADRVEGEDLAPLARLWARVSLEIEDIDRVVALGAGDPAGWPDQVGALYAAVTDGRDRVLELAQDTDLGGATTELEVALDAARFGGPAPPDISGGGVQPFLDSLAFDAWDSYRDAVREQLDRAMEAAAGT